MMMARVRSKLYSKRVSKQKKKEKAWIKEEKERRNIRSAASLMTDHSSNMKRERFESKGTAKCTVGRCH